MEKLLRGLSVNALDDNGRIAEILPGEGRDQILKLMEDPAGNVENLWLRPDLRLRASRAADHAGMLRLLAVSRSCDQNNEIGSVLIRDYKMVVDTSFLKQEARRLLAQVESITSRIEKFEQQMRDAQK